MHTLTVSVLACLAAFAAASIGPHGGAVVSGPSGVVTSHGAIGPAGHGYGHEGVLGLGYGHGLHGGAVLAAPVATAVVVGPAVATHGLGYGLGYGYGHGLGHDGVVAVGHHGAVVQGPPTAPAVVAGPSGKIVADGLWGPTSHWGHGGHGW